MITPDLTGPKRVPDEEEYAVACALVVLRLLGGGRVHLYRHSRIPVNAEPEHVRYLAREGLITKL